MRKPGKRTITLVAVAVLALGGGAGLWLAGRMPGLPAPTFGAMAAADTTAADDDAAKDKAKDKPPAGKN